MRSRSYLRLALFSFFVSFFLCSPFALRAKNASLTAIELYSGPNGPAYVHVTDVLINGKFEVRACGSNSKIDKSGYGKLAKVTLSAGSSIEYGADGVLTLTTKDSTPTCVVPSELKFDKNGPFTPAELASRAVLEGKVVPAAGAAADALPPFKAGVKIVFVANPDTELAEYLRAERASAISWWKDYLSKYPSAPHTAAAKDSLVSLLVKQAQTSFDAFEKSSTSQPPSFKDLANARASSNEALKIAAGNNAAVALNQKIHTAMAAQIDQAQGELKAYRAALSGHTAGYAHLTAATGLADSIVSVDPSFAPAVDLQTQVRGENEKLETSLRTAETQVDTKRFDDAWTLVAPYDSFAKEVPRVASIVDRVYQFHFDRAQTSAMAGDWEVAVEEFQKSLKIKPTAEVTAALKSANAELEGSNNKKAANAALQQSQNFEQQHDYIQAYEVLANLPALQRSLMASEMERLSPLYVESASQTAKDLQQAHDPIGGLADELSIERAHGYLERAYALQNDPNLKDRLDDVSNRLSEYYLAQAKRYLDKPLGSGAGLGWSFLDKALQYKASNLEAVRDEMTKAAGAYQLRSRLSIRVVFRDQTSRRDSAGFAEQLADAIATGLEASGLPVRVIRPGETPVLEPNFQLVGDVLQHARTITSNSMPKDSKYRAGEQEVPNPEWNSMNREYEAANLEFQTAQQALSAIAAKGKKKDIADANERISEAQKKVVELHAKLDLLPKTTPVDIIKPYTYTQKDSTLGAVVQLQFRIIDSAGNQVEANVPVSRDASQKFSQLENVKPEDTEGVKPQSTVPDDIQFLTNVENTGRDNLIEAAKQGVAKLPQLVFAQARTRVQATDFDGAAEDYILYLNSTPEADSPERQEAQRFLREQYNIKRVLSSSAR
jgi:tetratricopeptide (TPR) repeat protein